MRRNGGVGDEGEREEGERKKRENEANLRSPFWAKSRGYSAFQYILPDLTPKTNRCASRFATTAEARRPSEARKRDFAVLRFVRHTVSGFALAAFLPPNGQRVRVAS